MVNLRVNYIIRLYCFCSKLKIQELLFRIQMHDFTLILCHIFHFLVHFFQSFDFSLKPKIFTIFYSSSWSLFILVSNLYIQHGIWTHYPKIRVACSFDCTNQAPLLLFLIMANQLKLVPAHSFVYCVPLIFLSYKLRYQKPLGGEGGGLFLPGRLWESLSLKNSCIAVVDVGSLSVEFLLLQSFFFFFFFDCK